MQKVNYDDMENVMFSQLCNDTPRTIRRIYRTTGVDRHRLGKFCTMMVSTTIPFNEYSTFYRVITTIVYDLVTAATTATNSA
jgi:hypothetical protein